MWLLQWARQADPVVADGANFEAVGLPQANLGTGVRARVDDHAAVRQDSIAYSMFDAGCVGCKKSIESKHATRFMVVVIPSWR